MSATAMPGAALPPARCDVAIIGGGPAGSAIAALLAGAGRDVALFERDAFPRDKLCGEFLSGEALRSLERVGCLERIRALCPARIGRARFTTASGRALEVALPREALGISRRAFDRVLLEHAVERGAAAFTGAEVRGVTPFAGRDPSARAPARVALDIELRHAAGERTACRVEAGLVIGAYGRRDRIDRDLERAFLRRDCPSLGFKRHMRPRSVADSVLEELSGHVEIHVFDGGYCGLSRIETGEVNACLLLEKRFLRALPATRWAAIAEAMRAASPPLGARLERLEPADDVVHAVAAIPFGRKERARGRCLFTGDAAGVIAPLCGDGQAMALESALLLTGALEGQAGAMSGDALAALARRWDRTWSRAFGRRLMLGRALQSLLLRPATAELLLFALRSCPPLLRYLVRATRG